MTEPNGDELVWARLRRGAVAHLFVRSAIAHYGHIHVSPWVHSICNLVSFVKGDIVEEPKHYPRCKHCLVRSNRPGMKIAE
jgi:hypothetical protein